MATATARAMTAEGERPLVALLDRVGAVEPALAERARAELALSLEATRRSAIGDLAWEASCLTASRFPVEIAVVSTRRELRTAVDVLAPEDDRRRALAASLRVAAESGAPPVEPGVLRMLRAHQAQARPRWGAWLGSRHSADGTRHKLYVEVSPDPGDARRLLGVLAPDARRILPPGAVVRFLGVPLDGSDAIEVYARPRDLDADDAAAVVGRAGFDDGAAELLADAGWTPGIPAPRRNVAVSVAFRHGSVQAVALFGFAHDGYGGDRRARAALLAQAERERWPSAALYAAATEPLAQPCADPRPFHTVVSDVLLHTGARERHVGLAPPATGERPAS